VSSERPLNCFVSFSAGFLEEASRLTELLQEMGVDAYRADLILATQKIGREILAAIQTADFICLIIGEDLPSPNVAFEAGLAIGLGKPILTLAAGSNVPFDFAKGVQIIRVRGGDVGSVRRDIARFVRHVHPWAGSSGQSEPPPRSMDWARTELARIRQVPAIRERQIGLVELVARLFQEQGSEVLREPHEGARVPVDLLVWNDTLVAELGGPLIVECKYYGGGSGSVLMNARHAFKQLAAYVEQSSAKLGLLVFDHDRPTNQSLNDQETPEALAFFIGDLLAIIGAGRLPDEIRRRRARAARLRASRGDAG
jgi:hypothetical protein